MSKSCLCPLSRDHKTIVTPPLQERLNAYHCCQFRTINIKYTIFRTVDLSVKNIDYSETQLQE